MEKKQESEGSGQFVAAAFKRALEGFGSCLERLCNELNSMNNRVDVLEQENRDLEKRVFDLEMLCGVAKVDKVDLGVMAGPLGQVQQIPEVHS